MQLLLNLFLKIWKEAYFGYFCTPFYRDGYKIYQSKVKNDLVAQLVEHNTFNVGALGSSPSGITIIRLRFSPGLF